MLPRVSDLTSDSTKTLNFIKEQRATGGGDFPEAVDDALEASLEKINWSKDARARVDVPDIGCPTPSGKRKY
jgi:hypothetical protein